MERLMEQYLAQKKDAVYNLPSSQIKTMKGRFYQKGMTISGWWQSEKLDGIHCIWTGRQLLTRNGNPIRAPDWWLLPADISLAGELYAGRGQFSLVQGISHCLEPDHSIWQKLKFCVFDIPDCQWPYERVYQFLSSLIKKLSLRHLDLIEHWSIKSDKQFMDKHRALVAQGAEGSILRNPKSYYQIGLSDNLLKYKSQIDLESGLLVDLLDRNAVIKGYNLSQKYLCPDASLGLKSFIVAWSDQPEIVFSVSGRLTKLDRCGDFRKRYPIGSLINIQFNELNDSGKPRFPRFNGLVI